MCQVSCMLDIESGSLWKSHKNDNVITYFEFFPDFSIFCESFCFIFINNYFFFTFRFSWVYETRSKQSGLTVLEIDIPTGYVIMNDTLRALVNSPSSPSNLKRAEFYKRKVVFYFEYVSKIFLSNISKKNYLF